MGFRFRRSFKVAPGLRVNLNKSGPSVTVGGKVGHTTFNPGRKTVTSSVRTGIPGLSYSKTTKVGSSSSKRTPSTSKQSSSAGTPPQKPPVGCLSIFLWVCFFPIMLSIWFFKTDKVHLDKKKKGLILAVVWIILLIFGYASPDNQNPSQNPTASGVSSSISESATATPEATPDPTAEPTADPTAEPTATPTAEPTATPTVEPTVEPTAAPTIEPTAKPAPAPAANPDSNSVKVWIPTNGGTKYHSNPNCSKMKNPIEVTKDEAISQGFGACKRCYG